MCFAVTVRLKVNKTFRNEFDFFAVGLEFSEMSFVA